MNAPVSFLRNRLLLQLLTLAVVGACSLSTAAAAEVENPAEVAGFFGQVTGTVKSVQPNDPSFVLAVTKAEADSATSTLKDGAPLVGKQLTFGVRMPKTNEVSHPHPDDTAYVKTLKPGMVITVKVFAPRSSPRVLRIREPGQPVAAGSEAPVKEKAAPGR